MRWLLPLAYSNEEMIGVVSGNVHHRMQPPRNATPRIVGCQLSQISAPPGCIKASFSDNDSPRVGAGKVVEERCEATCAGTGWRLKARNWLMSILPLQS